MSELIVIGGGPAGMMAAYTAAAKGINVTLLEKNEKLGKKLHITGKGRCNLTNNTDITGLMSNVISNPRFLYSAFNAFDSQALMALFEGIAPLKTERGGRVFPASDKANDINLALRGLLKTAGVGVELNCPVLDISYCNVFFAITRKVTHQANAIIIATGGLSYPSTGSTGDGYTFAKELGHGIIPTVPSLVPLTAEEPWIPALEGLSLRNVKCKVTAPKKGKKVLYEEIGEMLFTNKGITGPLILSASAYIAGMSDALVTIDLKPGLTPDQLDIRLLRDFETHKNKDFCNALDGLLPQRLIETIVRLSQIPPDTKVHTITRNQRQSLVHLLKNLEIRPTGNHGYKEAVITKGGVSTKEVSPSTLMSKHIPGLFFAGEVLDVDALTGGYNMQIAFSTGHLAGLSAAKFLQREQINE